MSNEIEIHEHSDKRILERLDNIDWNNYLLAYDTELAEIGNLLEKQHKFTRFLGQAVRNGFTSRPDYHVIIPFYLYDP